MTNPHNAPALRKNDLIRTYGPQQFIIGRVVQTYQQDLLHHGLTDIVVMQPLGIRTYEGDKLFNPSNLPDTVSYHADSVFPYDPLIYPEYFGPRKIRPIRFYQRPVDQYENPATFRTEYKKFGKEALVHPSQN